MKIIDEPRIAATKTHTGFTGSPFPLA